LGFSWVLCRLVRAPALQAKTNSQSKRPLPNPQGKLPQRDRKTIHPQNPIHRPIMAEKSIGFTMRGGEWPAEKKPANRTG
jgi:hypothetical protein